VKIPPQFQKNGVTRLMPTDRGKALVEYLKGLNKTFPLPEAAQ